MLSMDCSSDVFSSDLPTRCWMNTRIGARGCQAHLVPGGRQLPHFKLSTRLQSSGPVGAGVDPSMAPARPKFRSRCIASRCNAARQLCGAGVLGGAGCHRRGRSAFAEVRRARRLRSEEHTSEIQSLMRTSYAVFCLKKKKYPNNKAIK